MQQPLRAPAPLDLEDLVMEAARELAEQEELDLPGELTRDSPLFGEGGLLDSMALVRLVVAVEQAIEDACDVCIALADERAMSQTRSPYRTVGTLADYARSLLPARWNPPSP